jgi:hypothetical protein
MDSFDGPDDPAALRAAVHDALGGGGQVTLIFHPFLLDTDERFAVLRDVLGSSPAR